MIFWLDSVIGEQIDARVGQANDWSLLRQFTGSFTVDAEFSDEEVQLLVSDARRTSSRITSQVMWRNTGFIRDFWQTLQFPNVLKDQQFGNVLVLKRWDFEKKEKCFKCVKSKPFQIIKSKRAETFFGRSELERRPGEHPVHGREERLQGTHRRMQCRCRQGMRHRLRPVQWQQLRWWCQVD